MRGSEWVRDWCSMRLPSTCRAKQMMGTAWKMPVPHMNHSTPAASSEPWRKARTITTISMYLVVGVVIV